MSYSGFELPTKLKSSPTLRDFFVKMSILFFSSRTERVTAPPLTDVLLLELSRHVSLHEGRLSDAAVPDKDQLKLGHFLRLHAYAITAGCGSVGTAGRGGAGRGGRAKGFGEMKSVDGYRGRATGFRTLHACMYTRGAGAETCGATTLWCETMGTFVSLCTAQESGLPYTTPTPEGVNSGLGRFSRLQGSIQTTTRIRHTTVVPAKVSELQ